MNKIQIPGNLTKELRGLDNGEKVEIDGKTYEKVDEGEWEDDGKYQYLEIVFSLDGLFYGADMARSGSYYTDYHYSYSNEAYQVERKEKTVVVWEAVK